MAEWDVLVIGGGAAGLCAAAAAAEAGRSCLLVDRMGGGGELMNLGTLHDVGEDLTGPDLAARLLEAAMAAGAELGIAEVTSLRRADGFWQVVTEEETHTGRAVILAVGLAPGTLGLANEAAYDGRGLSHCASCDGPLFAGEAVVVAGADRWAQQEALELAATASSVTLVTQGAPAPVLDGVTILPGHVTALLGDGGLASVAVQDGNAAPVMLDVQGLFIQTGRRPGLAFAPAGLDLDTDGRIVCDASLSCALPGLFAAGDARAGSPRALAAAMADGRVAAVSACAVLAAG